MVQTILNDRNWNLLMDLSHGSVALCYQCGSCTAICPWGLVRDEPFSVRNLIHKAQLGFLTDDDAVWLCTNCGQCEESCPRGVKITEVMTAIRCFVWQEGKPKKGLNNLLWSIYWNNNPWSQPPSNRSQWSKGLQIERFDSKIHDLLLYVGCTSSYDRRAQKIARSLVNILNIAGIKYGILGDDEPCCGETALSIGNIPYFEEIKNNTIDVFQKYQVSELVTISPHCYHVFKNEYPNMHPVHYTRLLYQIINDGRINLEKSITQFALKVDGDNLLVTYQDPCFLGRQNGEYLAPRMILSNLPGVIFIEMRENKEDGLCCGGGGGRMWMETPVEQRFSKIRVHQALDVGAEIIATACPFCTACLEDCNKSEHLDLRVMDIAELVNECIAVRM